VQQDGSTTIRAFCTVYRNEKTFYEIETKKFSFCKTQRAKNFFVFKRRVLLVHKFILLYRKTFLFSKKLIKKNEGTFQGEKRKLIKFGKSFFFGNRMREGEKEELRTIILNKFKLVES
jgi:hypothetical protein